MSSILQDPSRWDINERLQNKIDEMILETKAAHLGARAQAAGINQCSFNPQAAEWTEKRTGAQMEASSLGKSDRDHERAKYTDAAWKAVKEEHTEAKRLWAAQQERRRVEAAKQPIVVEHITKTTVQMPFTLTPSRHRASRPNTPSSCGQKRPFTPVPSSSSRRYKVEKRTPTTFEPPSLQKEDLDDTQQPEPQALESVFEEENTIHQATEVILPKTKVVEPVA